MRFLLAILLPAIVLGALAWRSVRDQAARFENQSALLYQGAASSGAKEIASLIDAQVQTFREAARAAILSRSPLSPRNAAA